MRTLIFFMALLTGLLLQAQDETSLKKIANKNKDLLSLNAIVADKTYYSQAILEYQIVKKLLAMNSIVEDGKEIDAKSGKELFFKRVSVLPKIPNNAAQNLNLKPCYFRLPEKLADLTSGFQFRQYLFKGSNTTALQAFGIMNNEFNKDDLYVIIDYIQYKDNTCQNLPAIRYAAGIRSEFKISSMNLNKKNDRDTNNLSIENLAANVQFDKLKVNISMKTIGITGKNARLNIPTNTSFNVQTYGEYVKVIDFIRNRIDSADVNPEIIPIMDAHRTSLADINTTAFDELIEIKKRYNRYEKKLKRGQPGNLYSVFDHTLEESLNREIEQKSEKHKQLLNIDKSLTDLKQHNDLLQFLANNQNSTFITNSETDLDSLLQSTAWQKLKVQENVVDNVEKLVKASDDSTINKQYNDAINKIAAEKYDDAKGILEDIYMRKPTYGNVHEILNLLNTKNQRSNKEMNVIIVNQYPWLIREEILNKLK